MAGLKGIRAVSFMLAAAALQGCSYLLVDGPPEGHPDLEVFECSEGRGAPIADVIFAGIGIAIAVTAEDDPEGTWYAWNQETYALVGVGLAALYGSSSWVGFRRVSECRGAKRALRERLDRPLTLRRDPVRVGANPRSVLHSR